MADYDPDKIKPPKLETQESLENALKALEPYVSASYTRAVNVIAQNEDSELRVELSQDYLESKKRGHINIAYEGPEGHFALSQGNVGTLSKEQRQKMRGAVVGIIQKIDEEDKKRWLLEVWAKALHGNNDDIYAEVASLLDSCPYPYIEYDHHSLNNSNILGGSVRMSWYNANQTMLEAWPAGFSICSIGIRLADKEIIYEKYASGEEELNIKDPRDEVEREIEETDIEPNESETGLGVTVRGPKEFIDYIHHGMQEIRENRQLGISDPTEEKMVDLTEVLGKVGDELARAT